MRDRDRPFPRTRVIAYHTLLKRLTLLDHLRILSYQYEGADRDCVTYVTTLKAWLSAQ